MTATDTEPVLAFSAIEMWWQRRVDHNKSTIRRRERRHVRSQLEQARRADEVDENPDDTDQDVTGRRTRVTGGA